MMTKRLAVRGEASMMPGAPTKMPRRTCTVTVKAGGRRTARFSTVGVTK